MTNTLNKLLYEGKNEQVWGSKLKQILDIEEKERKRRMKIRYRLSLRPYTGLKKNNLSPPSSLRGV
jgi:predicted secreted protein